MLPQRESIAAPDIPYAAKSCAAFEAAAADAESCFHRCCDSAPTSVTYMVTSSSSPPF